MTSRGRGLQIDLPDSPVSINHLGSPVVGPASALAEMIFNDPFSWHDTHIYQDDSLHDLDVLGEWSADDELVRPFEKKYKVPMPPPSIPTGATGFLRKKLDSAVNEEAIQNDGNHFPSIWELKERRLQALSSGSPSTCSFPSPPSDSSTGLQRAATYSPAASPGSATWSVLRMYRRPESPEPRQPVKRLPKPHTPFLQIPKSPTTKSNSVSDKFTSASLPNFSPRPLPSRETPTRIRRLPTVPTIMSPSPSRAAPPAAPTPPHTIPMRRIPPPLPPPSTPPPTIPLPPIPIASTPSRTSSALSCSRSPPAGPRPQSAMGWPKYRANVSTSVSPPSRAQSRVFGSRGAHARKHSVL